MKKILIPVDYSENAKTALFYGLEYAEREAHAAGSGGAEAYILNVFQLKGMGSFQSVEQIVAQENAARKEAQTKLDAYLPQIYAEMGKTPTCKVQTVVRLGLTIEGIINTAETLKADLVVMGSRGATNLETKILGTNTAAVIDNVASPVLSIPAQKKFNGWHTLLYAVDLHEFNMSAFSHVTELARPFGAKIVCLHVNVNDATPAYAQRLNEDAVAIQKNLAYSSVEMQIVYAKSITQGIDDYMRGSGADVLVMAVHQRSLYQKIFSPSLTQKMSYHSHTPLLALHISD